MSGEGRTPSTKGAHTVDQRGAGTGQHVAAMVDIGEGLRFPRADLSPSKVTGKQPVFGSVRRGEGGMNDAGFGPPAQELNAKMVTDSGSKTPRERAFEAEMTARREAVSTINDRAYYPDALEDEKAEIAKGDSHSATKAAFRAKKAQ